MASPRLLLSLIVALVAGFLVAAAPVHARDPGDAFFSARPGALATAKARLAAGDATLRPALESLVKNADDALKLTPPPPSRTNPSPPRMATRTPTPAPRRISGPILRRRTACPICGGMAR